MLADSRNGSTSTSVVYLTGDAVMLCSAQRVGARQTGFGVGSGDLQPTLAGRGSDSDTATSRRWRLLAGSVRPRARHTLDLWYREATGVRGPSAPPARGPVRPAVEQA